MRLAKAHRCYTIAEAADLYGCPRNTVRLWLRLGLEPVSPAKPLLLHGADLNAFHAARRVKGKRPCQPGEIYCLPCRAVQRPAGGLFEYTPLTPTTGTVAFATQSLLQVFH
jgi:hypothetical protein